MTDLCRICDVALHEEDTSYVQETALHGAIFRVVCSHCGMPYLIDAQGDVLPGPPDAC